MTNPNGANQYVLDPRQKNCWDFYVNPNSETFNNGEQSAIRAGYSPSHAATITTEKWFQDKVRRMNMLTKAEKTLDRTLEYIPETDEGKIDVALLRVQTDVAKHITSTLGKNDGYSSRTESTGPEGAPLLTVTPGSIDIEAIAQKVEEELKLKKIEQLGIDNKGKTGGV